MVHSLAALLVLLVVVVYSFIRRLLQLKLVIEGVASAKFIQRLLQFVDGDSPVHFVDNDGK